MTTKEQIIETATKMFCLNGIKSIRMDDIASQMGISKRTLYEQFADKESLIVDCVNFHQSRQHRWMDDKINKGENVAEEIMIFLDCWEEIADDNRTFIGNLRKFYPVIYRDTVEINQCEGIEVLKEKLRRGISQGIFLPDLNTEIAVYLLVDIMNSLLGDLDTFTSRKYTHTQAFKYVFAYFFRGISTAKGIRIIDNKLKL